ncbi:hypothetical protein GCM10011389_27490 [Pontibacillus salipaludis]|uniref:Uncharacterized protein n=1 Tax=Pontibacillus salipaludis TaxID=1697394 RepID=A0ABQ1Q9C5_9BACI|nr:hypothetical protein GCM10011389_27490 [Pontibacillus salipaludis]
MRNRILEKTKEWTVYEANEPSNSQERTRSHATRRVGFKRTLKSITTIKGLSTVQGH